MSNFTPMVSFQTQFENDTVSMNLSRLKRVDIMRIAPFLDNVFSGEKMSIDDQLKLAEAMAEIVPQHVSDFRGLKDADGSAIQIETVVVEAYFQELVGEIMGKLFTISKPNAGEQKNLAAESADSTKSVS